MANLSKERRDRMIAKLEELKQTHNDDASIAALNEIENALREKKYGLVWEEHSEAVDDMLKENIPVLVEDPKRRLCKDENLPWNFIIEGDNLQALYLLEKTHRSKVDCIYIDPPYNTGARDWKYNNDYVDGNDEYRHSKWLSMMKSRLVVAKRLLNPKDSVLIVTIDEKEYLHLGCLLEELFPEARMQMVSSMINPANVARAGEFGRSGEYLFFVMIGNSGPQRVSLDREWVSSKGRTHTGNVRWDLLKRSGTNAERRHSPGGFYPIYINTKTNKIEKVGEPLLPEVSEAPKEEGLYCLLPIRQNGTEGNWQWSTSTLMERMQQGRVKIGGNSRKGYTVYILKDGEYTKIQNGEFPVVGRGVNGELITDSSETDSVMATPGDIWKISTHDATQYGSRLIGNIFADRRFTFPKSLYAVKDCIYFFTANKPNAIIIDFFSGSGTTLHAVNLLNAEDAGHRKCIMVTNNEISEEEQKEFEARDIHQGDNEWEERGIAKYVTWPRTVCVINGVNINGEPLKGNYIGSDIPMADGFQANVKYLKCEWTPRKPEDYYLSNELCWHVKELIELQTAQEVDGKKNVLILSKSDYCNVFSDEATAAAVERVWVNQNLIFNADEMKILRAKRFRYIPREFFSQELKEAGEYV